MALDDELLSRKEVRLFPSHHIKSIREAELRATASFLAVARAVSEFGRRIVSIAGGPGGRLRCYAEVPLKVQTGATFREERPDGVMRVTWGKKDWTALIEVKVGDNLLEQDQFDCYHTLACDLGFNALITISNQSALANGLPPQLTVGSSLLRKVPVVHLSWERLLSEAQLLSRRNAVADPDQQWMLEEWIRYVDDPQSRIIEPPQMGEHWNKVLNCASEANLGACKSEMLDVVQHWDAFLRKVALRLRAKLGVEVKLRISKAEQDAPATLIKNLHANAINKGELSGVFRVPDAAGDLSVVVLLASRSVQYAIQIEAPTEGKAPTRIKWMIKQLLSKDVPGDLVVEVHWGWGLTSQGRICDLQQQSDSLLWDNDGQNLASKGSPRSFCLKRTQSLPRGKGRSTAPVLEGIAEGVDEFYRHVVEGIRPFVPKAPQLPRDEPTKPQASDVDLTKEPGRDPETPTMPQPVVESEELRSQESAS
jgi:hypothetical protein